MTKSVNKDNLGVKIHGSNTRSPEEYGRSSCANAKKCRKHKYEKQNFNIKVKKRNKGS